jgi:hypothetical protein
MSDEGKKIEKTEQEVEQEVKTPELSEQDLEKVTGAGLAPQKAASVDKVGKSW